MNIKEREMVDYCKLIIQIIVLYFFLTLIEWFLHKHIMHGDCDKLNKFPFIGWFLEETCTSHINHHMDVNMDMTLLNENGELPDTNWELAFSWTVTVIAALILSVLMYASRLYDNKTILILAPLLSLLVSYMWNCWHSHMHETTNLVSFKEGMPNRYDLMPYGSIYKWLWKYHSVHHCQKGQKYNYNIICPGMDILMGTMKNDFCVDNENYCVKNSKDRRCKQEKKKCYFKKDAPIKK